MNYPESELILNKIKAAKNVVLSCHHHPDSDTVGSASALKIVLQKMGKNVELICPDNVPSFLQFIKYAKDIKYVKFEEYDFSKHDLFIICDTSSPKRLFIEENYTKPDIFTVVIDNHSSNHGYGDINLLDFNISSVCEMLYFILGDWGIEIDRDIANSLLSGISGDTGSFQYEIFDKTFSVADKLLSLGADIKLINFNLFQDIDPKLIKFWGLVIARMVVDPMGVCYSAIPYEEYKDFTHVYGTRETAASLIISKVKDTKMGFILSAEEPKSISVSFRSRGQIDTSKIALALGGGGHPQASGAWFQGIEFEAALNKTLKECKKALSLIK